MIKITNIGIFIQGVFFPWASIQKIELENCFSDNSGHSWAAIFFHQANGWTEEEYDQEDNVVGHYYSLSDELTEQLWNEMDYKPNGFPFNSSDYTRLK